MRAAGQVVCVDAMYLGVECLEIKIYFQIPAFHHKAVPLAGPTLFVQTQWHAHPCELHQHTPQNIP